MSLPTGLTIRAREAGDRAAVEVLGALAFGGDPNLPPPPDERPEDGLVLTDGTGRLLGAARFCPYRQWWGGRQVGMGGLASVAIHPDARGVGAASALLRACLPALAGNGHPISVLFPTAVELYRSLGWEVVGSLDDTILPTAGLGPTRSALAAGGSEVSVRTAAGADVAAIQRLYLDYGAATNGLLTREGPMFPAGPSAVLGHDLVALAESRDGRLQGYVSYDRGRGYGLAASLRVWDLLSVTPAATTALVRSLRSWQSTVEQVVVRGAGEELALALGRPLPPPERARPWMLRIVDAPAAVAARGYPPLATADVGLILIDPDRAENTGAWRLRAADGSASLERDPGGGVGLPALHVRGLALLYAGVADTGLLRRLGLLDGSLPGLDGLFAGSRPRLLDYF